jgi:16S rRNA (uracil1498-N3)-methyltransferase
MRLTRLFVDAPLAPGTRATLGRSAAAHVTRVLRLKVGDAVTLFNGQGGEFSARLDGSHGGNVSVAVGEHLAVERESPLAITLGQGVARSERMDLVVQKATELGVQTLVPVLTGRSVVRLDERQSARKVGHWRAIAIGACEQCGRNRLPAILEPQSFRDFLQRGRAAATAATVRLLLSPNATLSIAQLPRPAAGVTVLIGPEGGLTAEETQAATAAGFTALRLGPRVLRTETAAIVALTMLQQAFGDLN